MEIFKLSKNYVKEALQYFIFKFKLDKSLFLSLIWIYNKRKYEKLKKHPGTNSEIRVKAIRGGVKHFFGKLTLFCRSFTKLPVIFYRF